MTTNKRKLNELAKVLEEYRRTTEVVRACVQADLLGFDTPEIYDQLELAAIRGGGSSYEAYVLRAVSAEADRVIKMARGCLGNQT